MVSYSTYVPMWGLTSIFRPPDDLEFFMAFYAKIGKMLSFKTSISLELKELESSSFQECVKNQILNTVLKTRTF